MKKWIYITILGLLVACKGNVQETYLTPEKALTYFKKVESICNRDSGKLWGKNLYGPLMYVDRNSRKIIANQPDKEGLLKLKDGVYTGLYPREQIIGNTAVTYGGTIFGLAPLPTEEDEYRITYRAIHCLYHRFQQTLGLSSENFNIPIMDEKEARIWIKLEWKALKKAISTENGEQLVALRDALIFRGSNHESYPKYAAMENRFETYEGIATFTSIYLSTQSSEEFKTRLFETLDRFYSIQSYSRSYGTINGALYATLLLNKGFDFTTLTSDTVDLGRMVKELYLIELPQICRDVAGSISLNYNIREIYNEEETRLQDIKKRINDQVSIFTEKPVVFLELESPYFDFEPEDVQYLDTLGTLYNTIRVSDNWGKLTVDKGGCLVSNNYKNLRLPAKSLKIEKNHISSEGWHMILNDTWELTEEFPNYFVRKQVP